MVLRDDVVVSADIDLPAPRVYFELFNRTWTGALIPPVGYENRKRRADEEAARQVPARAAHEQKELEKKYGSPTPWKKTIQQTNGGEYVEVVECEWIRPGLHVVYRSSRYEDRLLIELESVFRAGQKGWPSIAVPPAPPREAPASPPAPAFAPKRETPRSNPDRIDSPID
jgi:hypothetical protein